MVTNHVGVDLLLHGSNGIATMAPGLEPSSHAAHEDGGKGEAWEGTEKGEGGRKAVRRAVERRGGGRWERGKEEGKEIQSEERQGTLMEERGREEPPLQQSLIKIRPLCVKPALFCEATAVYPSRFQSYTSITVCRRKFSNYSDI